MTAETLWTIEDVAAFLKIGESTAYRLAASPSFPKSVKLGKAIRRWIPSDITAWVAKQR